MATTSILWFTSFAWASALSRTAWLLSQIPLPPPVVGGRRGRNRRAFFGQGSTVERGLRFGAAVLELGLRRWGARFPRIGRGFQALESAQTRRLVWAGQPAGLSALESAVLSLALGITAVGVAWWWSEGEWVWTITALLLGCSAWNLRIAGIIQERFLRMSHELPAIVDLTALAMNAGADFPGALRKVVERQSGVAAEELQQVLFSLELGITRQGALLALEERFPIVEVRDLVRAVIMAEKKGASVALALEQQAKASRARRSVRAEEAAARAGVLLIMPLMLLMACVMILLVGPLFCQGVGF